MICASVITYELSKRLGKKRAAELVHRQAGSLLDAPGEEVLPAVRVVRELRRHHETALLHDAGGTSIGHARSRAFSVALAGDVDFWISIDDDTEASPETIAHLLGALERDTPRIVIVPCFLRQETACVNITLDPQHTLERVTKTGARLRRALYGGFGIVAVTRAALHELARTWAADLTFVDDDGQHRCGVFVEYISHGWWFREDYAFFSRVPPTVQIEALCTGETDHDGLRLELEQLDAFPHIPRPRPLAQP